MTRRNIPKRTKRGQPRPRPFSDEQLWAVECLALLGATNQQMSDYLRVGHSTFSNYLKRFKEFQEAIERGRLGADMRVAEALYKRAIGYDFLEEQVQQVNGRLRKFKVLKHIVPDVKAAIHWLRNRQKEQWSAVGMVNVDHHLRAEVEHKIERMDDIPVEKLSEKSQEYLFEIGLMQLTQSAGRQQNTRDN